MEEESRTARLDYHGLESFGRQSTRVAISTDGFPVGLLERAGDASEKILLLTIDLRGDWTNWIESEESVVRRSGRDWEGALLPVAAWFRSSVNHAVNQLCDPFVLTQGDEAFLVYAVAGVSGRAIARLHIT